MKVAILCALGGMVLLGASAMTQAENRWSNYQGVDTSKHQHRPSYPQNNYPQNSYPQHRPHYPSRPTPSYPSHPPHGGYPPIQNGVSIQYHAPTTITQNSQSYSWVNGDPNTARIESSNSVLITDWRRLGLPAPPTGMYWIYEHGRYVLVPNR
ncbi:RcnB family protein [Acinetobacter sp.]|uniref:RcnB family protein n=1 Tax=Acinetobacter sp. TaxID=472 RepID=UPI002FC7127D